MDESTPDPRDVAGAAQDTAGPQDRRRPMDAVSVTAFVLSLIGVGLVAIPLGIWGVVRADSGRRRGQGLAVAALVISAAWAVVAATFLATSGVLSGGAGVTAAEPNGAAPSPAPLSTTVATAAPAPTESETQAAADPAPLAKPRKVHWADLKPGMCVRSSDDEATDIRVVDCRAEHEAEVMARPDLGGGDRYPGDEAIEAKGEVVCRAAFADYVGLGYDESRLELDFWWSDRTGWEDGEHTLICLVEDPSQGPVTSALRGTAQ